MLQVLRSLREGSMRPGEVDGIMEDFSLLLDAFVASYGSEELQDLAEISPVLEQLEEVDDPPLTALDRNFLGEPEVALQLYVDSHGS